jgi:hypothetical protein
MGLKTAVMHQWALRDVCEYSPEPSILRTVYCIITQGENVINHSLYIIHGTNTQPAYPLPT